MKGLHVLGEGQILLGQQHPPPDLRAHRSPHSPSQHSPLPGGRRSSVLTLVAELGMFLERRWETIVVPGEAPAAPGVRKSPGVGVTGRLWGWCSPRSTARW